MAEVTVSKIVTRRKLSSDQALTDATKNGSSPADLDVRKLEGAESTSVNSAEKKEEQEMKNEGLETNCDSTDEPDQEVSALEDSIIVLHLDIEEPLHRLRKGVEEKVNLDLCGCGIWLLNSQLLDDQKNLVEQGVEGEGQVQIHVELKSENETKKINIVDVLKPAEEYVNLEDGSDEADEGNISEIEVDEKEHEVARWVVDPQFKKKRAEFGIPEEPLQWNLLHVGFWLEWVIKTFKLTGIDTRDWNISGQELCNMNLAEFRAKVPNDPDDLFWTHLELLRKCKLVATTHSNLKSNSLNVRSASRFKPQRNAANNRPRVLSRSRVVLHKAEAAFSLPSPNHSGNNGQIQLWQFLLELLTDWKHVDIIRWRGAKGEFRFVNPEEVARLWGKKKRKPTMNYEKLSRALRYYYEGDMISKVQSKRFVYKFVCNLKDIIGYDAKELRTLVSECAASNGKEINYTPEDLVDF